MPTYVKIRTAGGAETVTDQLAGTAVAFAGRSGIVRAAFMASVKTHTAVLRGRKTGAEIIPNGSTPTKVASDPDIDAADFVFAGKCEPGEPLELSITAAAAGDAFVAVQTE